MRAVQLVKKVLWGVRNALASPAQRAQLFRQAGVNIGEGTVIYPDVKFGSEPYLVTIGADCQITEGCRFITHGGMAVFRRRPGFERADLFTPVSVGDNVYMGIRTIVLPGAEIGDNVLIGAGSVVSGRIPSGVVAAGVPCRPIKTLEEYLEGVADTVVHTKGLPPDRKQAAVKRHLGL